MKPVISKEGLLDSQPHLKKVAGGRPVMTRQGLLVLGLLATLLLLAAFAPDAKAQHVSDKTPYYAVIAGLGVAFVAGLQLLRSETQKLADIFLLIAVVLLGWEVLFAKLGLLDPLLFPAAAKVALVFLVDREQLWKNLVSSMSILVAGYMLAVAIAIPVGLLIGWRKRLYNMAYPVAKTLSPIPPTVYLPYTIALLPTFYLSSVFMIFIGAFWPVLVGAVYGVFSVDQRVINSARTLGLKERTILKKVIFPAALPSVFSGAMISLIISFISLTVAEIIGSSAGLGWYIEYHHQFSNYDRVLAGMILIALVVMIVMQVFDRIQKHYLRWQTRD